jgi:GNAT superfamily N-acetyltransferase
MQAEGIAHVSLLLSSRPKGFMAGQRLAPIGFAEVSAVCTHPDFCGRGDAQALVAAVARDIHSQGRIPFLTSFEANTGAVRIYQQVGFVHRRTFQLAVLKPPHHLSASERDPSESKPAL